MLGLPTWRDGDDGLRQFAGQLKELGGQIGFKVSARGWAYQLEGFGLVTKAEFGRCERLINTCRSKGYLPIDFIAEEEGRRFSGVEMPQPLSPREFLKNFLSDVLSCEKYYAPDWWDGEQYYIQMIVEKIDLKTLFEPVCQMYHIPVATTRGWSSMLQRAEYAKRFAQAEQAGLECVLLYCGDHDPDGLRISDFLRGNLRDLEDIVWEDGILGYDPERLEIERFGLNYDFIAANGLTWIENLITSSKKDLASPSHPNHRLPYVQDYLQKYGARKCEANALVVRPDGARELCRQAIERYLGSNAISRFEGRMQAVVDEIEKLREDTDVGDAVRDALGLL